MLLPKGYHSSTCKKMQDEYWDDQLVTDRLNDIDNESNSQIYQFLIDKIKEMASVDKGLQQIFQNLKFSYEKESDQEIHKSDDEDLLSLDNICANSIDTIEFKGSGQPNKVKV